MICGDWERVLEYRKDTTEKGQRSTRIRAATLGEIMKGEEAGFHIQGLGVLEPAAGTHGNTMQPPFILSAR